MSTYRVTIEIDVEADSEADACEVAAEDLAEDTGRIVLHATAERTAPDGVHDPSVPRSGTTADLTVAFSLSDRVRDLITPDGQKIGGRRGNRWAVIARYSDGRRRVVSVHRLKREAVAVADRNQRWDARR